MSLEKHCLWHHSCCSLVWQLLYTLSYMAMAAAQTGVYMGLTCYCIWGCLMWFFQCLTCCGSNLCSLPPRYCDLQPDQQENSILFAQHPKLRQLGMVAWATQHPCPVPQGLLWCQLDCSPRNGMLPCTKQWTREGMFLLPICFLSLLGLFSAEVVENKQKHRVNRGVEEKKATWTKKEILWGREVGMLCILDIGAKQWKKSGRKGCQCGRST